MAVAVSDIFSFEEFCDLENRARVRSTSKSLKWQYLYIAYEFLFAFRSNYGAILYSLRDIATYW